MRFQRAKGDPARRRRLLTLVAAALGTVFIAVQVAPALAQAPSAVPPFKLARDGYTLTKSDAEAIESALKSAPDDLAARTRLLGFYFRGATHVYPIEVTIEARRRHILWLIENRPESEASALSEATIDAKGHSLADPVGFERAGTAWIEQARLRATDVRVPSNAANFFRLSDKERALSYLRQAQLAQPRNSEWSIRIGYVYALAILGVDMVNQNGLPTSHNAAEAKSAFALLAIDELKASSNAGVVGVAGSIIGKYGLILNAVSRGALSVDHATLSETFLTRAQQLDPSNPHWARELEELRKLRSMANQPK